MRLRQAGPTLALGLLLTLSSSIGQTYFIGLFAGAVRGDLVLSHVGFGGIYTLATTASAACLLWLGKVADRVEPARLAAWVMLLLAVAALAMAMADAVWLLAVALFGLRFFGQGMPGHIAVTMLARRFAAGRGRALGIAMLGYPIGEALLPLLVALALAAFDWRAIWLATALAMVLMIPAVLALGRAMRRRRRPDRMAVSTRMAGPAPRSCAIVASTPCCPRLRRRPSWSPACSSIRCTWRRRRAGRWRSSRPAIRSKRSPRPPRHWAAVG